MIARVHACEPQTLSQPHDQGLDGMQATGCIHVRLAVAPDAVSHSPNKVITDPHVKPHDSFQAWVGSVWVPARH